MDVDGLEETMKLKSMVQEFKKKRELYEEAMECMAEMQRICYTKLRDQGFSEQEALFLVGMQFYPRKFWKEGD